MKIEQFSEALGNVNDKYINEAIDPKMDLSESIVMASADKTAEAFTSASGKRAARQSNQDPKRMRRHLNVWRAIAIAACAVLVAAGGFVAVVAGIAGAGAKSARSDNYYSTTPAGAAENYGYDESSSAVWEEEKNAAYDAEAAPEDGWSETTGAPQDNLKIIYTAYLYMETTEFDTSMQRIEDLAKQTGAYFEDASVNSSTYNYRTASYVIRVPEEKLEDFLAQAEGIGTITSLHKNAQDVTESYYDIETRLETAKAKMARLQELLAAASNVEDMIIIEREISDTQYQIDSLTGSLRHYDSQISYSTVSLELREVYKITDDNTPLTFGQRITNAFKGSVSGFGNFLEGLVIFLARSWIWLLIVAAIVVVVVTIIVKARKKHRK